MPRHVNPRPPRRAAVDLDEALEAQPARIRVALQRAHAALERLGIPHVVVGGLAVGAHGYPRATTDIDFLVGAEAFVKMGRIDMLAPGVPFDVGGVRVDYLTADTDALADIIEEARGSRDVEVVPLEALIAMKVACGRMKDRADVVELIKAGADVPRVRVWLREHAPEVVRGFDGLVRVARVERE